MDSVMDQAQTSFGVAAEDLQGWLEQRPAPELLRGDDVETRGSLAAWATFSACGLYRYVLGRVWEDHGALLVVSMLNPSTATDAKLDPTLVRVRGFAKRDGFGGFIIVNAYAYRSTDRRALLRVDDPVGPRNDEAIQTVVHRPPLAKAVAGWGRPDNKAIARRCNHVRFNLMFLRPLWTFGNLTKQGHPRHPLYLPSDTPIQRWSNR